MKRNSKTIIPYEDIDCELVELIKCINEIDGIETKICCCGHGTSPCQIWFKADSIEDVTHFIYNYLYCNPLWRIVFNLTDNEICDEEWNNPTYLLETTCSDYFYTGVSIDNLTYKIKQKQRELQIVDESNFDNEQYKADLQCAYDCGYVAGQKYILEELTKGIEEEQRKLSYFHSSSDFYVGKSNGYTDIWEKIQKYMVELKGE